MPSFADIIAKITLRATAEGVDDATGKLRGLAAAQDGVAVASDTSSKAMLSIEKRLSSLKSAVDEGFRSEQRMEQVERTLSAARAQGSITLDEQNRLLGLAKLKYTEAGEAAKVMGERVDQVKEIAKGLVVGLGAGLAFTGLAELPEKFKQAIEAAAGLKETSETIGITAENLQRLNYAASQSGISSQTMTDALEKFSKNLGTAATGTGALYKVLEANHIAISGDVTKDFERYANLVQNATSAEQRNYLVTTAFGKNAQEMGRLFEEGGEGIAKMAAQADSLGIVLAGNTLDGAKELNQELSTLNQQFSSTFSDFALLTAPLVISAMHNISDAVHGVKLALDDVKQGNILQAIADIEQGRINLSSPGSILSSAKHVADAFNPGAAAGEAISNWLLPQMGMTAPDAAPPDVGGNGPAHAFIHGSSPKPTVSPNAPAESAAAKAAADYKRVTDALNLQIKALTETDRQKAIDNELSKAHVAASSKEGQAITDVAGKYYDEQKAIQAANQAANFLAQTTESAFEGIINGSSSVQDALMSIVKALAQAVLQAELLGSGPLAGILGTAPTTSGGAGGVLGSLFSALIPHANGGVQSGAGISAYSGQIVSSPTIFPFARGAGLMGEAGPEAIMPLKRGADGKLGVSGGGSGGVVNLTVNVDAPGASKDDADKIASRVADSLRRTINTRFAGAVLDVHQNPRVQGKSYF